MNLRGLLSTGLDTKAVLSTLWIVVLINMLKADILGLYIPGATDEVLRVAGDTPVEILMLGGAILVEISAVMIILSRVLRYRVNRWANIIVGLYTIVFIWGGGSSYPHYIFVAAVETVFLLIIIGIAWRWREESVLVGAVSVN